MRLAMSARVSRLFPLLGGRRGTLGGSSGMDRRGGGGMTVALLLDRRFVGTRVDLTPDIFYAVAAVSIVEGEHMSEER